MLSCNHWNYNFLIKWLIRLSFTWFWFWIDLRTNTANHFSICLVCAFPTNSQLAFLTLIWNFVTFAFLDLALPFLWYCCSFEVIITFIIFSWGMIIASLFIVLLQLQRVVKKRGQAMDVIQLWLNIWGPSGRRCQHRTFLNYNNVQFQRLSLVHYQ